jgi:hypothetical protein
MDGARELLVRLCFSGPLLYIGLTMAMDPAGFVNSSAMLAGVLSTLAHRLRGLHGQEPLYGPGSVDVSGKTRFAVRFVGLALAACALLVLAGFVD